METDTPFNLNINVKPLKALDKFALLASQDYNLGNSKDWFGNFRGGLYGFYSRKFGVETHYLQVHSWLPKLRPTVETEYHVASIFFGMDSAIECFVFMLNALGYGANNSGFRDVGDPAALRRVSPNDVLGNPASSGATQPLAGYGIVFPTLQTYWQSKNPLIRMIMEQHDASKHRHTTYSGGKLRNDPPQGFFESLGIEGDPSITSQLTPHAEIIVTRDPKQPKSDRVSTPYEERIVLETIAADFSTFITQSCIFALDDATSTIMLEHNDFQQA